MARTPLSKPRPQSDISLAPPPGTPLPGPSRPPIPSLRRREALDVAADWVAGTQLDGVGLANSDPGGGPRAKAAGVMGPESGGCCGLGEWNVEARALSTFRHEFPDRFQHHDYLPGEPLPPPQDSVGSLSQIVSGPPRCGWPRSPASSVPGPREGVTFAESDSLRPGPEAFLWPSAPRPSLHLPTTPHPPLSRPFLEGIRWPQCSELVPREGRGPQSAPKLWTELLTHGLGKRVVPGAECASGQSGLAPGDTWALCWLSNAASGCGGICHHRLDLQVSIVHGHLILYPLFAAHAFRIFF